MYNTLAMNPEFIVFKLCYLFYLTQQLPAFDMKDNISSNKSTDMMRSVVLNFCTPISFKNTVGKTLKLFLMLQIKASLNPLFKRGKKQV